MKMRSPLTSCFSEDGWMAGMHLLVVVQVHVMRVAETGIFELRSAVADASLRVTGPVSLHVTA